ncbi:hypothetical protein I5E51_33575, partial [Pseudomonas aeruginosa]|nr:hypothetical protein [Pseudomonas aeruginosa]MBG5489244.1 hypothetical protein [Pseudomonas aeruginosa]
RQHQELGAGTNRVPEPGAGSGTAANIKGSVTRSRDNYLENRRETEDLETVPVPIGDLPLLRRNRLVRDGYLLHEQYKLGEEADLRLTLDLSPENLNFFRRFATDKSGPILNSTKHSSEDDKESLFVGIGYNSDPFGIIIPCVDIFSFFYANSTFLTQLVLSESILKPETAVYDSEKSKISGRYRKIWLKEGIPSKDARFLAMLLFDKYALEAAQSIYLHRGPEGRNAKIWSIRATPPIKGKTKLKVKGRYQGSRLIVTEILKCDWTPPFDYLEWERDNRSSTSTSGTLNPGPIRKLVDIDSPEKISDEPGDRRTVPSEVKQDYLGHRFPRLKAVSVKRSPKPSSSDKNSARYARENVPTKEATTALGGSGPSKRRADIREPEEPPRETTTQRELENVQPQAEDISDQCVSSALMLLAAHNHDLAWVDFINPGFAKTTLLSDEDHIPLCLLPSTIDNKESAWLFSDKSKLRQRVALIARVEYRGEVRFVIELQKRMNQSISTTLIWRNPDSEIQKSLLNKLLLLIAGPTKPTERTRFTTAHDLQWGRCWHKTLKGTEFQRAEEFLSRLFETSPLQEEDEGY